MSDDCTGEECRWPADDHPPQAGEADWDACGQPAVGGVSNGPTVHGLRRLPVCEAHWQMARRAGWHDLGRPAPEAVALVDELADGRRAGVFAAQVHGMVEKHPLWLAADRSVEDEDQLVLDILAEVLTYSPPPPAGHVLYSVPVMGEGELQVLALAVPALQGLDPDAARRAVRYLSERFT